MEQGLGIFHRFRHSSDVEQGRVSIDVLGGTASHAPIPGRDPGVERVDRVQMIHLVILLSVREADPRRVQFLCQRFI